MKKSQEFAVALLNLLREHSEILADALEEEGRKPKANELRRALGETQVVDVVDHVSTRPQRVDTDTLFKIVRDVAAPGFYLRKDGSRSWHIEVMCRSCRIRAALVPVPPRLIPRDPEAGMAAPLFSDAYLREWRHVDVRFTCHGYQHEFTLDPKLIAGVFE